MNLAEYENMQPHVEQDGIVFLTPNQHCAWRVSTLYSKEPDTIEWLKRMAPGHTFFDVGSNMGQYALFAARRGIYVHAFEPESQNFALLVRNIAINKLGESVKPWPLALSEAPGLDYFHVQSLLAGGSCSAYGEEVNFHLQPKKYPISQGAVAATMDDFAKQFGYPSYIKIDVDGFEHKVVKGAQRCIAKAHSVLVELNTALPEHMDVYNLMAEHGLHPDDDTAARARRSEGAFKGIGNVIFFRDINDFLSVKYEPAADIAPV